MSSLIFWGPYLTHQAIVKHRREKKRQKNYERWEGLRDEYDDMKRVSSSQRASFDYQQTPPDSSQQYQPRHSLSSDRDLFTLRDQQEAGDARTAWTPQERWEGSASANGSARSSLGPSRNESASLTTATKSISRQKTGAWDEGLPEPLKVSKRNYDNTGKWYEQEGSASSSRHDFDTVSRSVSRESEGGLVPRTEEVQVVESPYEWWK